MANDSELNVSSESMAWHTTSMCVEHVAECIDMKVRCLSHARLKHYKENALKDTANI